MNAAEDPIWTIANFSSHIYIFAPENGVARVLASCKGKKFDKRLAEMYIYDESFLDREVKIDWEIQCYE